TALAAAPAPHQFDADQEADGSAGDDQLLFVLLDLRAPVGHFGDLAAQRFDVRPQRLALEVDVTPDFRRRAAGLTGGRGAPRFRVDTHLPSPFDSVSLVSLASSIACVGTGGEPALTALKAISAASAAISRKTAASMKKPGQVLPL